MSRIGSLPIPVPEGVTVEINGHHLIVAGPLGKLEMEINPRIKVELSDGFVKVMRKKEDKIDKSLHGLTRSLIANMVEGIKSGWQKKLELVGVGFRAQLAGDKLILLVGFSHPVEVTAPVGIQFAVEDNTKIAVSGIDKQLVGQITAKIRSIKPPEPYKGKGIRLMGEYIRRKVGKAGKVGVGAK